MPKEISDLTKMKVKQVLMGSDVAMSIYNIRMLTMQDDMSIRKIVDGLILSGKVQEVRTSNGTFYIWIRG